MNSLSLGLLEAHARLQLPFFFCSTLKKLLSAVSSEIEMTHRHTSISGTSGKRSDASVVSSVVVEFVGLRWRL